LQTAVGRLGEAREIAATALFLAGPGASYFTGQVLSPNGGLVILRPPGAGHGTALGDPLHPRCSCRGARPSPMVHAGAPCVRVDGSSRGHGSCASTRTIRGGGGSARLPSWGASRAALAGYQHRRGDGGG